MYYLSMSVAHHCIEKRFRFENIRIYCIKHDDKCPSRWCCFYQIQSWSRCTKLNFIHIDLDIIRTSNLLKVNAYEIYHKIWNLFSFSHFKGISLCIINIKDCVKIIDLLQNYSLHFNHIFLVHLDVTCWQNMIEYNYQVIAHFVHKNTYSIFWILRCIHVYKWTKLKYRISDMIS